MSSKKSKKKVESESDSDSDSNDDSSSSSSDSNSSGSDNSDSDSSDDEVVPPKRPAVSKKKGAEAAKRKKKKVSSSEDDSDDDDEEEFDDGYDDDMMGDEEDRKRLEKMSELDRETELERRHEERRKRQMISRAKANLKKKKKEETEIATPRSTKRRTEQDKERNKQSEARKQLLKDKRDMEKKKRDIEQTKDSDSESEKRTKKKRKIKDDDSSDSDEDASEDDSDDDDDRGRKFQEPEMPVFESKPRSKVPPEKLEDADVLAMRSLHVSRDLLTKWVDEPFFEEAVVGAFVRPCLGKHPNTERQVYLLCEVKAVMKKSTYTLGTKKTDKRLLLAHGKNEKLWRMDQFSNSRFSEQEVKRWHERLQKDGYDPFTKADAFQRLKEKKNIDKLYVHTEKDIQDFVKKKREDPNYIPSIANEKSKLLLELEKLQSDGFGNGEMALEIKAKIKLLDNKEEQRKLKRDKDAFIGKLLNQRNRMKNEERDNYVAPKKDKKVESLNPFQRRDCRPSISWAVGEDEPEDKGDEATKKAPTPKAAQKASTPKPDENVESGKDVLFDTALNDIKNIKDTKGVDEFEEFIQVTAAPEDSGEKEEAGDLLPKVKESTKPVEKKANGGALPKEGRKRRGLSLKDYMKKAEANQGLED